MLYIIGIGLEKTDLSIKAIDALKKCKSFFIDTYTTPLPFKIKDYETFLKKILKKQVKINTANRELLEDKSSDFLKEAKKKGTALLVYGDPLIATTHLALVKEAKQLNVKIGIIHNISILNAITETGLSIYKFGKIASMPAWQGDYKPKSFYDIIKQNLSINAHTLLLIDIPLDFKTALCQLKEADKDRLLEKIFACSQLGTRKQRIVRIDIKKERQEKEKQELIKKPFCFVVPASLEFYENDGARVYN